MAFDETVTVLPQDEKDVAEIVEMIEIPLAGYGRLLIGHRDLTDVL